MNRQLLMGWSKVPRRNKNKSRQVQLIETVDALVRASTNGDKLSHIWKFLTDCNIATGREIKALRLLYEPVSEDEQIENFLAVRKDIT